MTIGELARRTGVSTRTLRFWSDEGLVAPVGRTRAGYRSSDEGAIARTGLVRTLRELGVDLPTVRRVLDRRATLHEVATTYADVIDAQIRMLTVQRSVLRAVAARDRQAGDTDPHDTTAIEELTTVHRLARLSAVERERLIHELIDETFADLPNESPVAAKMRAALVELPDEPSPAQLDAWIELAELIGDGAFRSRIREMAVDGARGTDREAPSSPNGIAAVLEHAGAAAAAGVDPTGAAAAPIVERITAAYAQDGVDLTERAARADMASAIRAFADERVDRYWRLVGTLNGWEAPVGAAVPAHLWFAEALEATPDAG